MEQTKQELRREMLKKRKKISNPEEKSLTIQKSLLSYIEERSFDQIMIYVSYNHEVETFMLIQWLLLRSYVVGVPKVQGKGMDFIQITSLSQLKSGSYGILEPEAGPILLPTKDSFIIVPGVAFDRKGGRIGYGGGFYDRYLAGHMDCYKMAAAFEEQILEEIPLEKTDYQINGIMTEETCYEFN